MMNLYCLYSTNEQLLKYCNIVFVYFVLLIKEKDFMRKKFIFIFLTLVILLVGDTNKAQCISEVLLSEDKFKSIKDELNIIEKY